jgi:hypothetical protein
MLEAEGCLQLAMRDKRSCSGEVVSEEEMASI